VEMGMSGFMYRLASLSFFVHTLSRYHAVILLRWVEVWCRVEDGCGGVDVEEWMWRRCCILLGIGRFKRSLDSNFSIFSFHCVSFRFVSLLAVY